MECTLFSWKTKLSNEAEIYKINHKKKDETEDRRRETRKRVQYLNINIEHEDLNELKERLNNIKINGKNLNKKQKKKRINSNEIISIRCSKWSKKIEKTQKDNKEDNKSTAQVIHLLIIIIWSKKREKNNDKLFKSQ